MRCRLTATLICAAAQFAVPAHASDRWEEAGSGAVAILPVPQQATGIVGGSLHCAEQRWTMLLRSESWAVSAGWRGTVRLAIGQTHVEADGAEAGGTVRLGISANLLEPLKLGSLLRVEAEDGSLAATFSLRGSGAVITAIAPRCSPVDMSAYERLVLSESDPAVEIARDLLVAEAKLFRADTGRRPSYAAAMLDLPDGARLLFSTLCGSTSYYGPSGCTLSGHASDGAGSEWRLVYNTEGLLLHIDPRVSNGGWPNLVTLPLAGGIEPEHWAWTGTAYETVDVLISGDSDEPPLAEGDAAD